VRETSSSCSAILCSVVSNVSSKNAPLVADKPVAEILVEGELSPFEHEALFRLLKKHFRPDQRRLGPAWYSGVAKKNVGL
jgi:hypothetical protein